MKVALGEIADIVSGATPKSDVSDYWGGNVQWVTPADLSGLTDAYISTTPRTITDSGLRSCSAVVLPPGSVLLSSRAPIGHVAITSAPMATNQGFKSLVPRRDRVDAKYLYHWLRANKGLLQSLGNGATFKEISKAVVARVEVPLPPLDDQRRLATILDQADALRAKRRQVLVHLDSLKQAAFAQMSAGGHVERIPLAQAAQVWDCAHTTPRWQKAGLVCLRTSNLLRGGWNWEDTRYVDGEQFSRRSRGGEALPGDIILSREGTVGIGAIVTQGMRVAMGQRLVQVRFDPQLVDARFGLEYLLRELAPERISKSMVGSTSQHLNVKDLRALPIPLINLEDQRRFARVESSIAKRMLVQGRALASEDALIASLQYRAFRGEL